MLPSAEAAGVRQSRLHNKKKSLSKRDLYDSMGADSPALKRKYADSLLAALLIAFHLTCINQAQLCAI